MALNDPFSITVPAFATDGLQARVEAIRDAIASKKTHSNADGAAQTLGYLVAQLRQLGL